MGVTLSEMKVGRADKVDRAVIDEFVRNSKLLAAMPFDNAISPNGGSTLTYGYLRLLTSPAAEGRAINSDYTADEATKEKVTTDLVIMGGSYQIDRVIGDAAPDEVAFQTAEKIKATTNRFHYLFINGNADTPNEFDGIADAVNGTSTDFDASAIDASTMTAAVGITLCEKLDEAILAMSEKPTFICANSKAIIKLKSAARALGYLTPGEDAFGKTVDTYNGIEFLDMGRFYNESLGRDTEVIPIDGNSGKTSIYLVALSKAGVHGVTLKGDKAITSRMPDFSQAGAVKTGDVEFVASIAIKNTRAVARLKNIQVAATLSTLGDLTVTAAVNKVTVVPNKAKIGNSYYYLVDASKTINAPAASTAINTLEYAALPANGVIVLADNGYVRVVEVGTTSKLPVATGIAGPVKA
jgi:hypothetical protein